MTPSEIDRLVTHELGNRGVNRHGWDFRPYLLSPPIPYEPAREVGAKAWLILEEPGEDGCRVVYDEDVRVWGTFVGESYVSCYDSLAEALDDLSAA